MAGELLLPPSPNWFTIDAIDCRAEDRLMVSGTYKAILVQYLVPGKALPKLFKVIPNYNEKVHSVSLCPQATHTEYGHTVACISENSKVRLFNLHTGDIIQEHKKHENFSVNSITWGNIDGEEVVVTVGGGGVIAVWEPVYDVCKVIKMAQALDLNVVQVNPKDRSQAVVAVNKDIALIALKGGKVLTWFKGHEMTIYCIRWYLGSDCPLSPLEDDLPTNSRAEAMMEGSDKNKSRQKSIPSNSKGPFFASSDHGRNVFIWDVSNKRYVTRIQVPYSSLGYKKTVMGKDKGKLKHHIPLAWYNKSLLTSTVLGELLEWTCLPGKFSKFKVLCHLHKRAMYNLLVMEDLAVTYGQDRMLYGFDVKQNSHLFQLSTLGSGGTSITFCPQDANRLALGSVNNTIRLLKMGSPIPLQTTTISNNINGKILSLCWHPEEEGHLLFSTGMGQVGWINVFTNQLTTFAFFHQKSAYKVEWAPAVSPKLTEVADPWCAYSFGDKQIFMRKPSDPMGDPYNLKDFVKYPDKKKFPNEVTEFSFSPDYFYLAVGLSDGQVIIYRREDLEQMIKIVVVKKAVQHLLWKPEEETNNYYTLAVASNETKIYIFSLDNILKEQEDLNGDGDDEDVLVTQATRELSGHEARVVWLAWSPHDISLLASASYDNTVQLWNTNTGSMVGNYGGHVSRVFRVEFSPTDSDLVFSCADESSLHAWKISKLSCKTPAESNAILKEYRAKRDLKAPAKEEKAPKHEKEIVNADDEPSGAAADGKTTKKSPMDKKQTMKSFFPKLHTVSSRKKCFHHVALLSILSLKEKQKEAAKKRKQEYEEKKRPFDEDELMAKFLDEEPLDIDVRPIVTETTEKYQFLLEKEMETPSLDDFLYLIQMHGESQDMNALLTSEIEAHVAKGNTVQADLIHCWRGDIGTHVRTAAKQKKLNPFLVACAPQVSVNLWEAACVAYSEQLVEEGDVVTAAAYLINVHKAAQAIELLLNHRHYRIAYAITKTRYAHSKDLMEKVMTTWISAAIQDGNMDLAASLQLSANQYESAARSLARRADPGSLFVSSVIYETAGNIELATSTGLRSLREALVRQETEKVDLYLPHFPELEWFKVLSTLHSLLLKVIEQKDAGKDYYLDQSECVTEGSEGKVHFVMEVKGLWDGIGYSKAKYGNLHDHFTTSFTTHQTPTSVKELWFLVSVSLCKCLLAPTYTQWDQHLQEALGHAISWGKQDQIKHLTHALLPGGKDDSGMLMATALEPEEEDVQPPPSLETLQKWYESSEEAPVQAAKPSKSSEDLA